MAEAEERLAKQVDNPRVGAVMVRRPLAVVRVVTENLSSAPSSELSLPQREARTRATQLTIIGRSLRREARHGRRRFHLNLLLFSPGSVDKQNNMPKLRLYYPIRPFHVNQHFGDNIPCVKDFGLSTQTVTNGVDNVTCPVGYDKLYAHFGMLGHNGTDLMAGEQNIYAACDGIVVEKQEVPARGFGVGILTNEQYDFGTYGTHYIKLRYWHLKSFACEVGDKITVGQIIGVTNNTGYSSGNHLHFEGQPMDKDSGGHPILANPLGSIAGAINLELYFTGAYADEVPQKIANLRIQIAQLMQTLAALISGRH